MIQEHRSLSLAEQVFERLENEILSGKYPIGEVLTEMKLAADLGVSRTPIREALHRLEAEHLIEIGSKGILIVGVSRQDLADIFAVRAAVEGLAARTAAERITDGELAQLHEALELQEFYVPRNDPDHVRSMDSRFHSLLYRASGSTVLEDVLLPLHRKVQKYRRASVSNHERAVASAAEHRRIFEAVAAHDADGAERATRQHIENAASHILKSYTE